jgi:hypothetical protein
MRQYDPRHEYDKEDTREHAVKHRKRKKERMRGMPIDTSLLKHKRLIDAYMSAKHRIKQDDFDLICYLASFVRSFEKTDSRNCPIFYGWRKEKTQYARLIENGYITVFEGHSAKKNRMVQYKLARKGRDLVTELYDLMYMVKKISLNPGTTNYEFIKKYKNAIMEFNKDVEASKEMYH